MESTPQKNSTSTMLNSGLKPLILGLTAILATPLVYAQGSLNSTEPVTFAWDSNQESEVTGYKIYYGTVTGDYSEVYDAGLQTSSIFENLPGGVTYYAVVTAYTADGEESLPSPEISFDSDPSPSSAAHLILVEAEAGAIVSPMSVGTDSDASSGKFVTSSAVADDGGTVNIPLQIKASADYQVWGRVRGAPESQASLVVSIDSEPQALFANIPGEESWPAQWTWSKLRSPEGNALTFNLTAGSHQMAIKSQGVSTSLDRVILSSDPNFKPSDDIPPTGNYVSVAPPPQSRVGVAGSSIVIQAEAAGTGPVTYQWFRNGTAIPGATESRLTVENLGSDSSGNYTISATSGSFTALSSPVNFSVAPWPEFTLAPIASSTAAGGHDSVRISVQGVQGLSLGVEYSNDLTQWTPLWSFTLPDDGSAAFTDDGTLASQRMRFYRLSAP